jgi:hypothetical protein
MSPRGRKRRRLPSALARLVVVLLFAAVSSSACASPRLHDSLASYKRQVPGGPDPRLEYADAELVHRVRDDAGHLEVFTDPRDDAAAADALATLVEMHRHIAEVLGGPPPRFRLFLRTGVDPQQPVWLLVGISDEPSAFPVPVVGGRIDDGTRSQIVRVMTHEWVEQAVVNHYLPFDLYDLDRATRWVGDGIAELVSALVCVRLGMEGTAEAMVRGRVQELASAKARGHVALRLDQWLRKEGSWAQSMGTPTAEDGALESARYAASLGVWWTCFEKRQDGLLPAFLSGVRALPVNKVDSAQCARVLTEISGVDVASMLATWTVDDAATVLERAAVSMSR